LAAGNLFGNELKVMLLPQRRGDFAEIRREFSANLRVLALRLGGEKFFEHYF
jgi:hypothetical protein